jgi:hypothetical protein
MRRAFSWKPFTSFSILLGFVALLTSGLVLYVAPPGRIANWTRWSLGPLAKEQWQAVHTVFGLVFLVAAAFHLMFNWRVLLAYLRRRIHTGVSHRREFGLASLTMLAVLALTLGSVPPFSTVVALGERAKNSWVTSDTEPPLPHAEGFTLARLAEVTKQPVEGMLDTLRRAGIATATPTSTVGAVAAGSGLTPQQLYAKLRLPAPPPGIAVEQGLGRKSVRLVCEQLGLDTEEGLRRLEAGGVRATAEMTMKDVASAHGRTPHDILPLIRGGQ